MTTNPILPRKPRGDSKVSHRFFTAALTATRQFGAIVAATALTAFSSLQAAPQASVSLSPGTPLNPVVTGWGDPTLAELLAVPGSLSGSISAAAAGFMGPYSVAVKPDGTVLAWGDDLFGQTAVPGDLTGVVAVSAKGDFTLALKKDGTVLTWGDTSSLPPVPTGLSEVTAIAAGAEHSLALKSDGTIVRWGNNGNSQLNLPENLSGVVAIAAGMVHSVALKSDGTVVACGTRQITTELGQPPTVVPAEAAEVPAGLDNVIAIAAGGAHSLALKSDGTVVAWGDNSVGQTDVPQGLTGVVGITAGDSHSAAIKADGSIVVWGRQDSANLTVPPASLTNVLEASFGSWHAVALAGPSVSFETGETVKTFQIENVGDSPLTVTSVTMTGAQASDFTVQTSVTANAIQPGQSETVQVTYASGGAGLRKARLHIASDSASLRNYWVALSAGGSGGPGPDPDPEPEPVSGAELVLQTAPGQAISTTLGLYLHDKQAVFRSTADLGTAASTYGHLPLGQAGFTKLIDGFAIDEAGRASGLPKPPQSLPALKTLTSNGEFAIGVTQDGTAVGWGKTTGRHVPTEAGIKQVVIDREGSWLTMTLLENGELKVWANGDVAVADNTGVGKIFTRGFFQKLDGSFGSVNLPESGSMRDLYLQYLSEVLGGGKDIQTVAIGANGEAFDPSFLCDRLGSMLPHVKAIDDAVNGGAVALTQTGEVWQYEKRVSGSLFGALIYTLYPAQIPAYGVQAATSQIGKDVLVLRREVSFEATPIEGDGTTKTLYLHNPGTDPLTIESIGIYGVNALDFVLDQEDTEMTLAAGASTSFKVKFTPKVGTLRQAFVLVRSNASNDPIASFALSGSGLGTANTKLSQLRVNGLQTVPEFHTTKTEYTGEVAAEGTELPPGIFAVDTEDKAARITINGVATGMHATGGTLRTNASTIPLAVGKNEIKVVVISSDESKTRAYTLTITRKAPVEKVTPLVVTGEATNVELSEATIEGTLNDKGYPFNVYIDYGTAKGAYPQAVEATVGTGTPRPVSGVLTGLLPHTKYFYRVRAAGDHGTASGKELEFTTGNIAPEAEDDELTVIQLTSVVDVLANDTDENGDQANFRVLSFTPLVPATAGKLAIKNGKLSFTATPAFQKGTVASASFSYKMTDGFGGTSEASVTLSYSTEALSFTPSTVVLPSEGGQAEVTVTSNATWTVTEALAWVTVTELPGGSWSEDVRQSKLMLNVAANAAKTARTGQVKIGNVSLTVNQAGASKPKIGPMDLAVYTAMIGARFNLAIPTENGPVTYTATGLPPGLKMDNAKGAITGLPTKAGYYHVKVKAKNAAAAADETLSFTIMVNDLSSGVVGNFHGYIDRSSALNGLLGSRVEITTTAAGAYSGSITTGTKKTTLKGLLNVKVDEPMRAKLILLLSKTGPLLEVTLDGADQSLTGLLSTDLDDYEYAEIHGWRNTWTTRDKAAITGRHSFLLENNDPDETLPQGYGYGSVTVDAKTGVAKFDGKTADGNLITGTTFVGPNGEVLLYQSLYAAKGSMLGVLKIKQNGEAPFENTVEGSVDWFKPATDAKTKDEIYRNGFGPMLIQAEGAYFQPPAKDARLLDLAAGEGNAEIAFTLGGLEVEAAEFIQPVTIEPAKMTPKTPINALKVTKFVPATGVFEGTFTLSGGRTAAFGGQVVTTEEGPMGFGNFLVLQLPEEPQTEGGAVKKSNVPPVPPVPLPQTAKKQERKLPTPAPSATPTPLPTPTPIPEPPAVATPTPTPTPPGTPKAKKHSGRVTLQPSVLPIPQPARPAR